MMMFCTIGALADQLQAQAESETNALQPQHQYVPWVRHFPTSSMTYMHLLCILTTFVADLKMFKTSWTCMLDQ